MCILDLSANEPQLAGNLNEQHLNKLLMLANKLAVCTSLTQEKIYIFLAAVGTCISLSYFFFIHIFLFSFENSPKRII